jgi:hypothetical protein
MEQADLLKALAIVNIFETGKPYGEFGAVAVLDDGAGISYGVSQFTHRSGSLAAVVDRYLEFEGTVGRYFLENALPNLRRKEPVVIRAYAKDERFKKALRAAAVTREMRIAQLQVAFEKYLRPAMDECERLRFVLPLSLAVVHDSMTHGSYERFRDHIKKRLDEKAWITEYVRIRDRWLASVPRLTATRYRTRFFLDQIALGRWDLKLPLNVHGYWLRDEHIAEILKFADVSIGEHLAVGSNFEPHRQSNTNTEIPPTSSQVLTPTPQAQQPADRVGSPNVNEGARDGTGALADARASDTSAFSIEDLRDGIDTVDAFLSGVAYRTDRAKSLWTTVVGSIWQTAWAIVSFLIGLPRFVWFAVAIIVAALTLFYLYRQILLGKLREDKL